MVYVNKTFKKNPVVKKYRKRPVKKARSYPVPSIVKQYVKRAIRRDNENKIPNSLTATNSSVLPMTSTSWGSIISLSDVWSINQGTGQANRLGNAIRPVMWNMKGSLYVNSVSGLFPSIIKMFVFKLVQGYQGPATGGALPSDFFQNGNSAVAPTNTIADMYRNVNTDKYKVYTTRTFKIGPSSLSGTTNNDFDFFKMFSFNLLKYQKHIVKYVDAGTTPTNSGLYLAFVACTTNDIALSGNDLKISYDVTAKFED